MIPLIVVGVALFAAHLALSRTSVTWAGAVVPTIWVGGSVVLAATGHFDAARHVVAPAVGLVGLVGSHAQMRQLRALRVATA